MVKIRKAPPKQLFHAVTWIEKDQYTLIEQSVQRSCSLAIVDNDICIQFRYIQYVSV